MRNLSTLYSDSSKKRPDRERLLEEPYPGHLSRWCTPFLLILVFTFSSCATPGSDRVKEAEAHYRLGISSMKEGKLQNAFVELQKAIGLNPADKRAHYALGLIYQEFGEYEKAENSLRRAIEIDPQYSEAFNSLGVLYMKTGRWKEAEEAFKKALQNPLYMSPEKALTNLAMLYYRLNKLSLAEVYFKKALRRVPDFPRAYYGLALCYNAMGRYGDAAEALQKGMKVDPRIEGDQERARQYFTEQRLKALTQEEAQDYSDLLEILYY